MDMGALAAGEIMLLGHSEPPAGSSRAASGGSGVKRLIKSIISSNG
jgi:hypothetical protein